MDSLLGISVLVVVVAGGVLLSRVQGRERVARVLDGLGFAHGLPQPGRPPTRLEGSRLVECEREFRRDWLGWELAVVWAPGAATIEATLTLSPAPLGYLRLARILGRGDLLGAAFALQATASETQLVAHFPRQIRARALRVGLDELARLASELSALPQQEALTLLALDGSLYGGKNPA